MSAPSNTNHPMTRRIAPEWHKLLVLLMLKQGLTEALITEDDINHMLNGRPQGTNITVTDSADGLRLKIVDDAEAIRLAKKEGGLPCQS